MKNNYHNIVQKVALAASIISLVGVLAIVGFQIYVRWTINQNFTFLGGGELEVLTASAFALTLGLAYIYRADE